MEYNRIVLYSRIFKDRSAKALLGFEPRISCLLDRCYDQLSHSAYKTHIFTHLWINVNQASGRNTHISFFMQVHRVILWPNLQKQVGSFANSQSTEVKNMVVLHCFSFMVKKSSLSSECKGNVLTYFPPTFSLRNAAYWKQKLDIYICVKNPETSRCMGVCFHLCNH